MSDFFIHKKTVILRETNQLNNLQQVTEKKKKKRIAHNIKQE